MEQWFCPLREWARRDKGATALIVDKQLVSRGQLDAWVEQYRVAFAEQGVKAGDRVVIPTVEPLDTVIIILACIRSRWVFCPINPGFPVEQVSGYCERISADWFLGNYELSGVRSLELPEKPQASDLDLEPILLAVNVTCDLIATSGTTGVPKAVCHTLFNHIYSAKGSETCIALTETDCWLLSLPLFHVGGYGIVIRCLLAGAVMAIERLKRPLGEWLKELPVTHLSLVNTQLHRLLRIDKCRLGQTRLKTILLGGGMASPALVRMVQAEGVQLLTTYGMTEMSSQVCTGEPQFISGGVSSGEVLPFRRVKLSKDGEILVRGETLSPGYFQKGKILSISDKQGWYHTGDKGVWISGQIKVTGRIDNMMISGGENIHPEEIEQVLLSIQDIVQAVVVSVEDQEFGYRPFAYVETASGKLDEVFTKRMLEGSISRFKIPGMIRLFPSGFIQSGLKPDRRVLQKLACELSRSANSN